MDTTAHHTHTATLDFYRSDVRDSLVETVANAALGALTSGSATVKVGAKRPPVRQGGDRLQSLHLVLRFYALNDQEAQRTVRVIAGALGPIVLGSVCIPTPERLEGAMT